MIEGESLKSNWSCETLTNIHSILAMEAGLITRLRTRNEPGTLAQMKDRKNPTGMNILGTVK